MINWSARLVFLSFRVIKNWDYKAVLLYTTFVLDRAAMRNAEAKYYKAEYYSKLD